MNLKELGSFINCKFRSPIEFVHVELSKSENKAEVDSALADRIEIRLHAVEGLVRRAHAIVRFRNSIQADREYIRATGQHLHAIFIEQHAIRRDRGPHAEALGVTKQESEILI